MARQKKEQPGTTPETNPKKGKDKPEVAKTEVISALKVEVHFPTITDLKQAIGFDADGNLILAIQFKSKVDQFEIFRLVNLLKQPHGPLYATLGSPQSAMDFKFTTDGKVEIVKAAIAAEKAKEKTKALAEGKPDEKPAETGGKPVKIIDVRFNHIPEDPRPYGVLIEYSVNGTKESKTAAGRGMNPTEAVVSGAKQCGAVAADLKEPFEVRAALESLELSPANYKLIRVLDVGSFDGEDKGGGNKAKGA